jgi:Alw26I/Eco31I/Esp3I family type II restriction m6 adenine DNA methyltransferase
MSKISGIASKSSPGFFMTFDFKSSREHLQSFDFEALFRSDLNWSNPTTKRVEAIEVNAVTYQRRMIAQVAGVAVYEVVAGQVPDAAVRQEIYRQTVEIPLEHLLIFVDEDRSQSYWYWVKRDGKKEVARHLTYYKGQSGDLILGKLGKLVFELEDFESGDPTVVDAAQRLQDALDVEKVTKKFYGDFKVHLEWFVAQIMGIDDENDRRWYASVILNRLMFVCFLQYKGFVDGNENYLRDKFEQFEDGNFYRNFLRVLFFEGFAKAKPNRSPEANQILGEIKYLNGGLFERHWIEKKYEISIANEAFEKTLTLFEKYSWDLDDSLGGKDDEVRPDMLGYVFENYINPKEFGAYYTRPEITEYLCDRTINKLILDKVNEEQWQFGSIEELLFNLDADLCLFLLEEILPKLSLLDPACGSGAFLVAAMRTLINVYAAVIGRIEFLKNPAVTKWLQTLRDEHPSIQYYIKKRIITDNLYGVDIMEEATEMTKLRLFLTLVASAATLEELEPLPNVNFNIMAGNSLIGLVRVDEDGFNGSAGMPVDTTQRDLLKQTVVQDNLLEMLAENEYRQILAEKNRSIVLFKERAFANPEDVSTESEIRTEMLKNSIEELNRKSQAKLNRLLFDEFGRLKIKYEQAQTTGKATKRLLVQADIDRLEPFHWSYQFDQIIEGQGGFDAVITNPPWEVFKPNAKEFFAQYDDLVIKDKMTINTFETHQKELMQSQEIATAWIDYQSEFPYVSSYFRLAEQYKNQTAVVNAKKIEMAINLYKLFLELCFNLLKPSGYCGIIVPSDIRNDLSSLGLRKMLLEETEIDTILTFSNEYSLFPGIHPQFKFCLLTFKKGPSTKTLKQASYDKRDYSQTSSLEELLRHGKTFEMSERVIRLISPNELLFIELSSDFDVEILRKMTEKINFIGTSCDFHRTIDSHLLEKQSSNENLPLYGGRQIGQFITKNNEIDYWINEQQGKSCLIKVQKNKKLTYQNYRLVYRNISRANNKRTLIVTFLPKNVFCEETINVLSLDSQDVVHGLFVCAVLNSFCFDYVIRVKATGSRISIYLIDQISLPPTNLGSIEYQQIVDRAAKLICTIPEFDDLAAEVGLGSHTNGVTDEIARANLRAELDGIIAHLYNLTEVEFAHILSTFPIVPQETKDAALQAYRDFAPIPGDPEIVTLLEQGESNTVEFKSTARWNLRDAKKDRTMEEVILKTVAAFLNAQGGTLLIGVADDGSIVGLDPDYQALKKSNRDGYELWLMNDLLLKEMGKAIAPYLTVTFHMIDEKDVCKIAIGPAIEPVYVDIRDRSGQLCETFFIRTGNSTNKLEKPSEITTYIKQRWK